MNQQTILPGHFILLSLLMYLWQCLRKVIIKNKFDNFFSKLLFLISMLIFIPNILFISLVFGGKLGNFAGIASFVICLLMLMLNSVPAITGLVDKKKDL